jgi:uncharacterized protein (DUF983 family)
VPSPKETARLFGRAFRLRCPNCGKGPVLRHWLKLRVRCGTCGLRMERGEHDYFVGSIFILFTLAGILVIGTLAVTLAITLPDVSWELLQYGLPAMMVLAMFALHPFSKLVWLAFDLTLRPVTPEELEWHRSAEREFSTGRDATRD